MDFSKVPMFRMMAGKMSWLADRQRVLAQNIANADTPKFQALDLRPVDFAKAGGGSFKFALMKTSPTHVGATGEGEFRSEEVRNPYEVTPSENGVVLEEQLTRVAQTAADYELMTSLYRKHMQMYRTALGRNGQ